MKLKRFCFIAFLAITYITLVSYVECEKKEVSIEESIISEGSITDIAFGKNKKVSTSNAFLYISYASMAVNVICLLGGGWYISRLKSAISSGEEDTKKLQEDIQEKDKAIESLREIVVEREAGQGILWKLLNEEKPALDEIDKLLTMAKLGKLYQSQIVKRKENLEKVIDNMSLHMKVLFGFLNNDEKASIIQLTSKMNSGTYLDSTENTKLSDLMNAHGMSLSDIEEMRRLDYDIMKTHDSEDLMSLYQIDKTKLKTRDSILQKVKDKVALTNDEEKQIPELFGCIPITTEEESDLSKVKLSEKWLLLSRMVKSHRLDTIGDMVIVGRFDKVILEIFSSSPLTQQQKDDFKNSWDAFKNGVVIDDRIKMLIVCLSDANQDLVQIALPDESDRKRLNSEAEVIRPILKKISSDPSFKLEGSELTTVDDFKNNYYEAYNIMSIMEDQRQRFSKI